MANQYNISHNRIHLGLSDFTGGLGDTRKLNKTNQAYIMHNLVINQQGLAETRCGVDISTIHEIDDVIVTDIEAGYVSTGYCVIVRYSGSVSGAQAHLHAGTYYNTNVFGDGTWVDSYNLGRHYYIWHGGLYYTDVNGNTYTSEDELVSPYQPSASEVVNSGYNIYLDTPYTFSDSADGIAPFTITGILAYKDADCVQPLISAKVGTTAYVRVNYSTNYTSNTGVRVSLEVQDADTSASVLLHTAREDNTYDVGVDLPTIVYKVNIPYNNTSFVAKAYLESDVEDLTTESEVADVIPLSTSIMSLYKGNVADTSALPSSCKTWTRTPMLNRIIYNNSTGVVVSEAELFDYAPYPNSYLYYPAGVLKVVQYKDGFAVVCRDAIHYVVLSDGEWKDTILQTAHFSSTDAKYIQVINNFLVYRSTKAIYMLVPGSTTSTSYGTLVSAPISRGIQSIMYDPESYISKVANYVLGTQVTITDISTSITGTAYNIQYVVQAGDDYYNFWLSYDTDSRIWYTSHYACAKMYTVLNSKSDGLRQITYLNGVTSWVTVADTCEDSTGAICCIVDTGYTDLTNIPYYAKRITGLRTALQLATPVALKYWQGWYAGGQDYCPSEVEVDSDEGVSTVACEWVSGCSEPYTVAGASTTIIKHGIKTKLLSLGTVVIFEGDAIIQDIGYDLKVGEPV